MIDKLKIVALIIAIILVGGLLGYQLIKNREIYTEPIGNDGETMDILYTDLELIPLDYDFSDMVDDGCYIVTNSNVVYNLKNLKNFISNVENNVKDKIRIIQYTIEGQPIITDLIYTKEKFILKKDNRRDGFSVQQDRIIKVTEYDTALYELEISSDTRNINQQISLNSIYLKEKNTENRIYICELANIKQTSNYEFELEFIRNDNGTVKILDKSETEKYDFDVYSYMGEVNVIIDKQKISLKDALINDKITIEQILQRAEKDLSEKTIFGAVYSDGGSKFYLYENYAILKLNKGINNNEDKNKDIYIGPPSMNINDI